MRQGFETIVNNAFVGFGFPSDSPVNITFPSEMFNTGSDLTPFEEGFQLLLSGLTDWEPKPVEDDAAEAKLIDFTGTSYPEVYAQVQHHFMRNSWSDSLPIVPPTEEYVNWILRGTDEDPNTVVGSVPPRNGICTVRNIAILLAMAGGRPEYLPFMIAAVKCAVDPKAAMQNWNATTNSVFPVFVVNGPERMNLRLGSGYGCLGPDPAHPAGQVMGRAIRLLQQVMGGAIPGVGTMALYGANRATNAFFAEDEEGIPETWTSWAEDRGYSRDKNVVTMTIALGAANAIWTYGTAAKNLTALNMMAATLRQPDRNRYSQGANYKEDNDDYASGVVFINRDVAAHLVADNGMSKLDVKKYLWENSFTTYEDLESWGSLGAVKNSYPDIKAGDSIPVCPKPEVLTIVIAGGDQGGHGYYMGGIDQGNVVSNEVKLPACWDDLLIDAAIDLGAAPAMH